MNAFFDVGSADSEVCKEGIDAVEKALQEGLTSADSAGG
jgi:hypothetical protein